MNTRLKPMTAADLPTVLATEAACYPEPWSQRIFQDCIEARSKGYRCHMLLLEEVVVGHAHHRTLVGLKAHVKQVIVQLD